MADIDRDYAGRERVDRTHYQTTTTTGNSAGWWIAGLLVLAVLIIGFIAMSGGEPAPVEPATTNVETQVAPPADGAAPMVETAPVETAPAAPAETAPAETAPAETAPAETAPAETAPAAPATGG